MARINSYPKASSMNDDDVLITDGATGGTRTVTPATLKTKMGLDNVAAPTSITNAEIDQIFTNIVNGTTTN